MLDPQHPGQTLRVVNPPGRCARMAIVDGVSVPGSYVEVRAEMGVLVLVSNGPQVNDPCNGFTPTPIRMLVWANPDG